MTYIGDKVRVPRSNVHAGVARRDVTPSVGIRAKNWGPAEWERAEGIHQPLTLTALALGGDDPHILIAIDATWWRRVDDERRLRTHVLEALALRPEALMICLSHTHAGPVICTGDSSLPGGEMIADYLSTVADAAIDAAREALSSRRPALIEWSTGRCALAANREADLDGRALVGFNPDAPADDTVIVGRICSGADQIATIVNYACHPTTLAWENRLISPDYVGQMRHVVEGETGAPCLFVQGASGELAPRHQYTGDVTVAERHGAMLGHAVLSALEALPTPGTDVTLREVVESGAPLAVWRAEPFDSIEDAVTSASTEIALDVADLPSMTELEERWADIDPRSRAERIGRARNLRDDYISGPTVQHPIWAWEIGDVVFVGQPGEAYSRFQQALRASVPGKTVVVMNLVNGPGFVYLPTDDAYDRGAYQAWQTAVGRGSLERVQDATIQLISGLNTSLGEDQ